MNNTIIIDSQAPSAWKAGTGHSWHALLLKSIKRGIAQIRKHRRLRRDTDVLFALDDRMLADIGLRRCEVEYAARHGRRFSDTSADGDR